MPHRRAVLLALTVAFTALGPGDARGHSGPRTSDPLPGATLGDTPAVVRLSFSERPEPALSSIRVLDTAGAAYHTGQPEPVPGDPLSLVVRVRPLPQGVYTVNWRVVSAVDGHATSGAYAFGVRAAPTSVAPESSPPDPAESLFEMSARWILITGLVALLGAATAAVARFAGTHVLTLAAAGWLLSAIGLALMAVAQRGNADVAFSALLTTTVGRALIWRAVAIVAAGIALAVARLGTESAAFRLAMAAAAVAALAAMGVHSGAGHAAAGARWGPAVQIAVHWAHFAAVGIWLGGLAALLGGVRGALSATKADAVRRFSTVAAIGLAVVVATGAVRTFSEISTLDELVSTGYGFAVLVKVTLTLFIAAFGAFNRWRSVAAAAASLRLLRRAGSGELALTAGALAAAAVLATLPSPASGLGRPRGLKVSGADFGTTVLVDLMTTSDQPGANRFIVRAVDYDSKRPLHDARVSLRFTPLDDPGVAPTSLALTPGPGDAFTGSGANLAFDGRWRVTARIERGGSTVDVPLEVETRIPPRSVSVDRIAGRPIKYVIEVAGGQILQFSPDPFAAGPSTLTVTCFDVTAEERPVEHMVITIASGDDPTRQLQVYRLGRGRFSAKTELVSGRNTVAAIARSPDGTRLRATVDLHVP